MTRIYQPCTKCKKRTCNRSGNKPLCITHQTCESRACAREGRMARQRDSQGRRRCHACVMRTARETAA